MRDFGRERERGQRDGKRERASREDLLVGTATFFERLLGKRSCVST
jgi:hypothetical protein